MVCATQRKNPEAGNAFIYVLIAVVLLAALSMTLARQSDTSEINTLSDEMAELHAVQLIDYATQAHSSVEQMTFSGSDLDDLVFTLPNAPGFNTPPNIHKVYHPDGGGLTPANFRSEVAGKPATDPAPGWYMGRFNNVEWTPTANDDVILVAAKLTAQICAKINEKITGDPAIPSLDSGDARGFLIDTAWHSQPNADFTEASCTGCEKRLSYCIANGASGGYFFYNIIGDQ